MQIRVHRKRSAALHVCGLIVAGAALLMPAQLNAYCCGPTYTDFWEDMRDDMLEPIETFHSQYSQALELLRHANMLALYRSRNIVEAAAYGFFWELDTDELFMEYLGQYMSLYPLTDFEEFPSFDTSLYDWASKGYEQIDFMLTKRRIDNSQREFKRECSLQDEEIQELEGKIKMLEALLFKFGKLSDDSIAYEKARFLRQIKTK